MFHVKHFASLYTLVIALVLWGVMFHVKHHSPFLHIAQKFRAKFFLFPVEISLICAILFSTILEWPGSSRSGRRRVSFLAKIIAIVNQKGGVGKTTTCVNLTAVLRERGKRVLLCDFDPQANSTSGMGVDKTVSQGVYDVLINGADVKSAVVATRYGDVLHSSKALAGAGIEMIDLPNRQFRLKQALEVLAPDYDYILIDCPPSLELLTLNALCAADGVIIPMQCEYYALEGLTDLVGSVKRVRAEKNKNLRIVALLRVMFDTRITLQQQVSTQLEEHFGDKVFKTIIPRNVRLAEAPSYGLPGVVYDRSSKGAKAYMACAEELIERMEKKHK